MRVTTDFWISALIRRVFADGGFAAVVKRGASEAGAIFIVSRNRLGEVVLYGPAVQAAYDSGRPDDRFFSRLMATTDAATVNDKLEKEKRFDSDIWVIEVETGPAGLEELISLSDG